MQKKTVVSFTIIGVIVFTLLTALTRMFSPVDPTGRGNGWGPAVAVIYLDGAIVGGRGQGSFLTATGGTDAIIEQLRSAREAADVDAVVLRINSPGGSAAASQEVYNEAIRLREAGKPLVASFADVAASGGYWVACAADEIVANPASMTGSIGVIMEVTNLVELYDKLGIENETVKSGQFKDIGSSARPLEEEEREILQTMVDDIFDQFVEVVSSGRGLSKEAVRELADGRIFTGRQALELGLVDYLGDMTDAVNLAGELSGIEGEPYIRDMGRRSPFEFFWGGVNITFPWQPGYLQGSESIQWIRPR